VDGAAARAAEAPAPVDGAAARADHPRSLETERVGAPWGAVDSR
jgi:hypothetical protein